MSLKFEGKKEVVSDLGFQPEEKVKGLCRGRLVKVEVLLNKVEKVKEDGSESTWEYAGYEIPSLMFTFHQEKNNPAERQRVLRHVERVITFKDASGAVIDINKLVPIFENMNNRIVHIHNSFASDPNYAELPDLDFDEKGDSAKRVASWKKFFGAIADAFEKGKNNKPVYVDAKSIALPLYLKVLADYETGSYYTLPNYVGKGFIERNKGQAPSIEIGPGEVDKLKLVAKKKKGQKAAESATYETTEELPDDVAKLIEQ